MFLVRLIIADSYQALPSPQLDPTFSEFRGSEIKYVPIIRIFGTTPTGKKTCLHLHGAFPYMYVPYTSEKKDDNLLYKLAASLDAAINVSLGTATSKTQHVYKIQIVTGIPLYGYHKEQHQFLKILFYNPMIIKKAASLLQNGSVMNQSLQPHEAHIPYVLQFMIDYNVHGMSWINLSTIKFRQASQSQTENGKVLNAFNCLSDHEYSTNTIECQSTCQLEADAFVSDILNRQEVEKNVDLNPGLAAIWNEEKARRFQNKFHGCDSQLVYPKSPKRPTYRMTIDDLYQERRFNQRLETISLSDKSKISKNEIWHPFQIENMEELPSSSTVEKPKIILNQCSNRSLLDCSVLDSADQPLVEMLDDLAQDDLVENDSILGLRINSHNTQDDFEYDMKEEKEMEDAEHEANDLTMTCMQLESLSSWSTIKPLFDNKSQNKTMMVNEPLMEKLSVNNSDSEELEFTIPQLDGIGDLSVNGFGSETSENLQVSKRVGQLNEKSFSDTRDINNRKCLNSIKSANYSEFLGNSDPSWSSASTNVHYLRAVVFSECKSYYKNITPEINKNIYEHKSDQHQFNGKDILRFSTTKNLNYNFNTVATSEKLQSVKFISNEIAKNECLNKLRPNNIFINRPFDDSIIRKRRKTLGNRLSKQTHQNNWPKVEDINRKFVKFIYNESMKNTFLHVFRNISITFKCLSPNDNYRSPQANKDNVYNSISNSYNENITRSDTKLLALNRYDQMLMKLIFFYIQKNETQSFAESKNNSIIIIENIALVEFFGNYISDHKPISSDPQDLFLTSIRLLVKNFANHAITTCPTITNYFLNRKTVKSILLNDGKQDLEFSKTGDNHSKIKTIPKFQKSFDNINEVYIIKQGYDEIMLKVQNSLGALKISWSLFNDLSKSRLKNNFFDNSTYDKLNNQENIKTQDTTNKKNTKIFLILNIATPSGSSLNIVNFNNIVNIHQLDISTMADIFQKCQLFDAENFLSTKKTYQEVSIILCSEDKKTDELSIQTKKLHACLSIHELNFDDQDKTIQIDTYEKKSYLNNIYDYRGDSKCLLKVSSDLNGSDKLCKKISQESFFVTIRLDLLEPRCSGWNPKITRTAFTQLQKPKVMLQRLSPATLKHYGYNQPLESKIFKNNFSIPSLDGSADFTSSDSEPDTDTSDSVVKTEEKRVCAYISKNNERKHKESDNKADQCIPINQTAQFSTSPRQLPKNYSSLEIFIEPKEASTNKSLTLQHKRQKILTRSKRNEEMNFEPALIKTPHSPDNSENITAQTTSDMISESRSISDLSYNLENKPEVKQTNRGNQGNQGNDKNIGSISNLMDISSMQLLNNHYDKSECTATFTKHLESKITESFFLKRSYVICDSVKKSVIIIPNTNPPKLHEIIATMKLYDFSKRQKKLAQQMLKVNSKNMINVPVFKSRLKSLTGINLWRKLKLQDFYSLNKNNKFILNASTVITPLLFPPSRKRVLNLMTARKNDESNKIITSKILISTSSEHNNPLFEKKTRINVQPKRKIIGKYNRPLKNSFKKNERFNLKVSNLLKQNKTSNRIGFSCGQIEYQSDSTRSNITNENLNNAKTLVTYDYLTILCIEIHANTRGDLLPDPQSDSINAIFYAIKKNIPPGPDVKPLEHGVIVVISKGQCEFDYEFQSNKHFAINHVSSEIELFERLIELISRTDPEIFIGWEIEFLSWGYLFQRAAVLDINLAKSISRIPNVQSKWESNVLAASESLQETKLPGRIVLDIWRIMRSEMSLLTYTFENVMYHVLNERLPCPSFKALTSWWELQQPKTRWKVIQHYCIKVVGVLRIIEQLDIIGRTSEHARLFGIQFYEVFSRGSQYRVESIMLRLAKPLNYIPVSPSAHQRASMRAMEALPLIMEPESMFYTDPLIVLDFQSLYPSIIIAYNICFSTCLGRIEHIGQPDPFEFGASVLRVSKDTALELKGKVNFTPCGVAFVKPEVRIGILPRMLTEILDTRFMVKKAMKDYAQNNKTLHRVLHSRQHGLKYLANVTYGYTAANFSGRMPCIEVGDSVISKAKETLERAIKLVESTTKWGARVVYGDTDSLFILIPGKSKKDAFAIGNEIADAVTVDNPSPIKLKFEKILFPSILQTKKRYCGYMYEQPDQISPKFLAKGIETVRRDGCPAVSKILEKTLKILFDSKDLSQVKHYITRQIDKILRGKVSLDDLTFAKEFRGLRGYKEKACVPALELTRRLMKKDPLALPRRGERVRYVIVCGAPNQALIHCVRTPWEVLSDPGLRLNVFYYITRVIIPPLNRCLNLIGVEVNNWLQEMPHRQILDNPTILPSDKQKHTIFQYFGNIVCIICESLTNKGICFDCVTKPTDTLIILNEKVRWLDRINDHITGMCQSCFGRTNDIDCSSLDCPVLYRRVKAKNDFLQANELIKFIEDGSTFEN